MKELTTVNMEDLVEELFHHALTDQEIWEEIVIKARKDCKFHEKTIGFLRDMMAGFTTNKEVFDIIARRMGEKENDGKEGG